MHIMSQAVDNKGTACAADSDQDRELHCCHDEYSTLLEPMSVQLKKDTENLLHELNKGDADVDGAKEKCKELILKMETELGQGHIICELITKLLAERLRKLYLLEDAIEFVNDRMERLKTEDFGSLLTLSRLYNLSGDYHKSLSPTEKALLIAKKDGDPVLQSLALAKLSCIQWHLQNPDDSQKKLDLCLSSLEVCDLRPSQIEFPFSDTSHRVIDVYKTIGYLCRLRKDYAKSTEFYRKAIEIVEKDEKAVLHLLKLETQIGCEFSLGTRRNETREYCVRAYNRIKELSKNEVFMTHHQLSIIHSLARIAHSMEIAERNDEVLELREFLVDLGEKYLPENHPEIARVTADTAYLCNCLYQSTKEAVYIEKAEAVLEHSLSQTDIKFIKTHVRELADAWSLLGKVYLNKDLFEKSEKCFKMAIAVNIRVYGSNHPRLGNLYRSMGYLYKKFDKFAAASDSFRKCKEITEEFNPQNEALLLKLAKELKIVSKLEKRKFGYS